MGLNLLTIDDSILKNWQYDSPATPDVFAAVEYAAIAMPSMTVEDGAIRKRCGCIAYPRRFSVLRLKLAFPVVHLAHFVCLPLLSEDVQKVKDYRRS